MTTNKQKIRELQILDYIYQNKDVYENKQNEKPDFILRHIKENFLFGVEITEFYLSETHARVKNIPKYIHEILYERSYRHRDDKKLLALSDIIISREGKPHCTIKGIFSKGTPINDYLPELNRTIILKNNSFKSYDKNLDHINLIIFDNESFLNNIDPTYFYNLIFTQELTQTIISSLFREIFFVTKCNNKLYYVPLKLYILISRIFLFNQIIKNHYLENIKKLKVSYYFKWLHCFFVYEKLNDLKVFKSEDFFEIVYGNYGLVFKNGQKKLNINNYDDYPIIKDINPLENVLDPGIINKEFISNCRSWKNNHSLTFKLIFPIE